MNKQTENIDSFESLYQLLCELESTGKKTNSEFRFAFEYQFSKELNMLHKSEALLLLEIRSWLTLNCYFDSVSGESLPTDLDDFLLRIFQNKPDEVETPQDRTIYLEIQKDRIFHLIDHCKESLLYLIKEMRQKILREHEIMPIYQVREVDMNTIIWLSNKPGKNVKQKLSSKPVIKAVRRRYSFDTLENRLLKFMCQRLEEIFYLREEAFKNHYGIKWQNNEEFENLYLKISRFMRNENVREIKSWTNERPNNVLLSDKRYKKILNSYNWLRSIDEDIQQDFNEIHKHFLTAIFWNTIAMFSKLNNTVIPQIPLKNINYHSYDIEPFCNIEGFVGEERIKFLFENKKIQIHFKNKVLIIETNQHDEIVFHEYKNLEFSIYNVTNKIIEYFGEEINYTAENQIIKLANVEFSVIDICSTKPNYLQNGKIATTPFKLLTQFWNEKDKEGQIKSYQSNCKNSKAIYIKDFIDTNSMYQICNEKKDENSVMLSYIEQVKEYMPSDAVLYLLPDNTSDFESSNIRKSMNFYFPKAQPLPKSIATIFAFQNSQQFLNVKDKDEFNVIDICNEGFSVTKISAKYDEKVEAKISETKGIIWERHPCKIHKENWIEKLLIILKEELKEDFAAKLLRIFGWEIINFSDVQFIDENNKWHKISHGTCEKIAVMFKKNIENFIKNQKLINEIVVSEEMLVGGEVLFNWQKIAGNLNLWYDHLPELKIKVPIDGIYDYLYLVKEAKIAPRFNEKTEIKILNEFILPAGKEFYKFPLIQGDNVENLAYDMKIEDKKQFPLSKNVTCKLILTYTYGEENPYELIFDSNEIQPIKAEWIRHEPIELDKLPIPDFPPKKSWDDLRKNWNPKHKKYRDLLTDFPESFNRNLQENGFRKAAGFLRFCAIQIFGSHSVTDPDCPPEFKEAISEILSLQKLNDKALSILAYLNDDAPQTVGAYLKQKIENYEIDITGGNRKHFDNTRAIAYSIGSCKHLWQKELLQKAIELSANDETHKVGYLILSRAFWHSEKVIHLLNNQQIEFLLQNISEQLTLDSNPQNNYSYWYLETLFALLLFRESDKKEIQKLVSPENEFIKKCTESVDKITRHIVASKSEPISYLIIKTQKPKSFEKIPDLLYALRMYLTCDDGANTIQIVGLNEGS